LHGFEFFQEKDLWINKVWYVLMCRYFPLAGDALVLQPGIFYEGKYKLWMTKLRSISSQVEILILRWRWIVGVPVAVTFVALVAAFRVRVYMMPVFLWRYRNKGRGAVWRESSIDRGNPEWRHPDASQP
jgi:hypothetical protein